ncbi:DNA replication and repair protein RecN [Kytococcus aerolatus]|uniref:DNA repair protein RecN n=1 Tax=Kytococcus aerolatus TaxID=592308 RepID=A0A212SZH0_9MICO|nr:DNA repair protein RecN [Kytococcus aerolatus]SNC59165.1 DNA replication and repair protein RecN [Kytococcus aerolatus]
MTEPTAHRPRPWLESVEIADLGVIRQATVDLAPGLTVITGETGAGKTMLVQSLSLLLGRRAESGWVRHGARDATVTGVYLVPDEDHGAVEAVRAAGGEVEDELIVTRRVRAAGRSTAAAGGARVPVGTLAGITGQLVAIHGQADQWRLLSAEAHREVLDAFGGATLESALAAYREARGEVVTLDRSLRDFDAERTQRAQQAAWLRRGLEMLEELEPHEGEEAELRQRVERLDHASELLEAGATATRCLSGTADATVDEPGSTELVARAVESLARVADLDPAVQALHDRTRELSVLLTDLAADVAGWVHGLEADPGELQALHERRAALRTLAVEFGRPELLDAVHADPEVKGEVVVEPPPADSPDLPSVDNALRWGKQAALQLESLGTSDEDREELVARLEEAKVQARGAADRLTEVRRAAAQRLGDRVTQEVRALAIPKAVVEVAVEPVAPGPHGADAVEIRMAPNPGAPPRTVAKAASGGELSRLMLALEVVLGDGDGGVPTMVFDEVDAGVGGEAAHAIGDRLARIARDRQVVVVTHLPQVAAYGDRHLVIAKSDDGSVTTSGIEQVEGEERLAELARMLGGVSASRSAREHAAELLEAAAGRR